MDKVRHDQFACGQLVELSTVSTKQPAKMLKSKIFIGSGLASLLWIVSVSAPSRALAADQGLALSGQVKAGKGQARLEMRRKGPTVEAAVCRRACDWKTATQWTLAAPFDTAPATFAALELGEGRRAGHLTISAEERRFELVLASPAEAEASASSSPAPFVAFAGETGLTVGEAPDRTGMVVEVLANADKTTSVVIGSVQEDISLCGRKALLSPRLLHPQTVSLKGIKLQRLPSAERAAAVTLTAQPRAGQVASNVFTPLVASSGKGSPAALTDDDVRTLWSENRGGSGGGEFVVFRAPESMGLTGLMFTLPEHPKSNFRSPRSFWITTSETTYKVQLPDAASSATRPLRVPSLNRPDREGDLAPNLPPDPALPLPPTTESPAAAAPENPEPSAVPPATTEWFVPFPSAVQTSCLALSLDTAEENDGTIDVGFAEIGATTDIDEARLTSALSDLDTGGDAATAAEQLLQDVGRAAFERVQKRYRGYSEAGRMRALNVMDAAPCRDSVSVYISALYNQGTAEAEHGRNGLQRCKAQAVPALARRLEGLASERTRLASSVLVQLDPAAAVDAMAPLLGGGSRAKRRVLQLAFEGAVRDEKAAGRAKALLSDTKLEPRAGVFLMRALGNHLTKYADVAAPRLRGWLAHADFNLRYLALSPAAHLANADAGLRQFVVDTLSRAKEPALRAEAARVLEVTNETAPVLTRAISDNHVRVREAAAVNAGEQAVTTARAALHERLETDPWPLVRSAAVRALAKLPPDANTAKLLAQTSAKDEAPSVRRPALHTLGAQNARDELPAVRIAFRSDADPDVRATAAASLGLMCDRTMVDDLTNSALKFASLTATESDRVVGKASLNAVGRLAPPDLEKRLAPFFAKGVPQIAQSAAHAAINHPERCGRQ